jgi:hypothetical protein
VTREFQALRTKYWPGRLLDWRAEHRSLPERLVGYCDYGGRRLLLDLDKPAHRSRRQRRATLLHECCHAIRPHGGHDAGFFAEVDRLHALGEPVLTFDAFGHYDPGAVAGFPRLERRWKRAHERWLRRRDLEIRAFRASLGMADPDDEF